jgi:molybdenum cofactor biosynthesis enzyme MoaA
VYDVLYLDRASHTQVIAAQLGRESAVTIARAEARRRRVGRMFLAGSEPALRGDLVVIVESHSQAA